MSIQNRLYLFSPWAELPCLDDQLRETARQMLA
jgi:hypothetical protein